MSETANAQSPEAYVPSGLLERNIRRAERGASSEPAQSHI